MNIAIFADIHGRILLAFKLCARWEHETGEKIDLILQAGDMGLYPAVEYLDKATMRHVHGLRNEMCFCAQVASQARSMLALFY